MTRNSLQPETEELTEALKQWENNDFGIEFEYIDSSMLLELAKLFIESDLSSHEALEAFLTSALYRIYSPEYENFFITSHYGNLLYRLSDYVPLKERKNLSIYPSENGEINIQDGNNWIRWDSLEDWRTWWLKQMAPIPEMKLLLGTSEVEKLPFSELVDNQ
jgi:hypothetical protein